MRDFLEDDIEMFKIEEYNILREMRGSRGHSVMVRQLLDRLNNVQIILERLRKELGGCVCDGKCDGKCGCKDCKCVPKKETKKAVVKPAVKK